MVSKQVYEETEQMLTEGALEKILQNRATIIVIGPLSIEVTMTANELELTVKLMHHRIAHLLLTPKDPRASATANLGIAKADLAFEADFAKKELHAEGHVCVFALTWKCIGVDEVIFRW